MLLRKIRDNQMVQERPITGYSNETFIAVNGEKEQISNEITYWVFLFSSADRCYQDLQKRISSSSNFHPVQYQQQQTKPLMLFLAY